MFAMDLQSQVAELQTVVLSLVVIGAAGLVFLYRTGIPRDKPEPKASVPTYYCRKHGVPESECAAKHGGDE